MCDRQVLAFSNLMNVGDHFVATDKLYGGETIGDGHGGMDGYFRTIDSHMEARPRACAPPL